MHLRTIGVTKLLVIQESWAGSPSFFPNFFNYKTNDLVDISKGREDREGKMSRRWAEQYTDHGFYGSSSPRTCMNPHCGHSNIKSVHILRHRLSGEVVEVGTHCYARWKIALGLRPIDTELRRRYIKVLRAKGNKQKDQRITPREMQRLEEETILEMIKNGKLTLNSIPANTDTVVRRRVEKNWILKYCKKNHITLNHIRQPLGNFATVEDAHAWARERGGYCAGTGNIRGKLTWGIFVNRQYRKGDY